MTIMSAAGHSQMKRARSQLYVRVHDEWRERKCAHMARCVVDCVVFFVY